MVFEEYDATLQGITNALGFESADGELRVWGDYEAYKAEVYARQENRGGRAVPVTVARLTMPSPAPMEIHLCTRESEAAFDVPTLPVIATKIEGVDRKLTFRASQPTGLPLVPVEILNKLSVDTEKLHLFIKGNVVGYEIAGEVTDANYWINAIEFLGKVADRVRKG